ncbi:DUF429 domain-containing protein [Jatrophihabitans fulvus]
MTVVGVDGWKGRWVAAVVSGRRLGWQVHATFADVLDAHPDTVVAVDMPIATTDGPRDVDAAGRGWLRAHGGPWQSIFLAPTTSTVAAFEAGRTHAEAMAGLPAGARTSIQAWNLIPAIVQVRDALAERPSAVVVEAHPECSFRAMDERIGLASKKTGRGAGVRLRALSLDLDVDLAAAPELVPVDDLLDAAAAAWTAARYERGAHLTLPEGAAAAPRIVV